MGTHPIFESDFDCLTDNCGGIIRAGTRENIMENVNFIMANSTCSRECVSASASASVSYPVNFTIGLMNNTNTTDSADLIPPVKDKFNYMNTMVYVMMPSLFSFFILTAGFYVLHGYTSANQIDELKRAQKTVPSPVPYADYANNEKEKDEISNEFHNLKNEKPK